MQRIYEINLQIIYALLVNKKCLLVMIIFLFIHSDLFSQKGDMVLWLRADDGPKKELLNAENNERITKWEDKSGNRINDPIIDTDINGNNSGTGPTFLSSSSNYQSTLKFNGFSDGLTLGDDYVFFPRTLSGATWFVVAKPDIIPSEENIGYIFDFGMIKNKGYGLSFGHNELECYTPSEHGGETTSIDENFGTENALVRFEVDFKNSQALYWNGVKKIESEITVDRLDQTTINAAPIHNPHLTQFGPFCIGRQSKSDFLLDEGRRFFEGNISEIIAIQKTMSAIETAKIESYLSLKHGLTRVAGNGQYDGSYLLSDERVIWDGSSTYQHDVIGIARDDYWGLNQKQSQSLDNETRIYIGTNLDSSNAANTEIIKYNSRSVIMGHNGGAMNLVTLNELADITGVDNMLDRTWRIANTDWGQRYTVEWKVNSPLPDNHKWMLLIGEGDDIRNSKQTLYDVEQNGNVISFEMSIDLLPIGGTRYLTLVTKDLTTPDIRLWLRSDEGVLSTSGAEANDGESVEVWQDKSFRRRNDMLVKGSQSPTFRNDTSSYINYHPSVEFNGVNQGMNLKNDYLFVEEGRPDVNWFAVVKPDSTISTKITQKIIDFGETVVKSYGVIYAYPNAAINTPTSFGGVSDNNTHTRGEQTTLLRNSIVFKDKQSLHLDGDENAFLSSPITLEYLEDEQIKQKETHASTSGPFTLGRQSKTSNINNNNGRYFDGRIMEVMGVCGETEALTALEIAKIESYLSLKYGLTRVAGNGQYDGSYLLSDERVMWDGSSTYQHDVIGIARDDYWGLNQKQSQSLDNETRIYIGTNLVTSNAENTMQFGDDLKSIILGHDNKAVLSEGSKEYPENLEIYSRLEREWKLTNIEFHTNFSIDIELPTDSLDARHLRMLVDSDNDLSDGFFAECEILVKKNVVTLRGLKTPDIPVNGTSYFTLVSLNEITPLPISLLYFKGSLKNDGALLEWATESEINNDRFQLHKSTDGKNWTLFDELQGAGNSNITRYYHSVDFNLNPGITYYKLIQTDYDGKSEEFGPVAVELPEEDIKIRIFPNPFQNELTLDLESTVFESVQVRMFDMTGRLHFSNTYQGNSGMIIIRPENLKSGVYIIEIQSGSFKYTEKVLCKYSSGSLFGVNNEILEQQIQNIEANTTAEVRVMSCNDIASLDKEIWREKVFYELGMDKTRYRNALLVLVDLKSGRIYFEGDDVLENEISQEEFDKILANHQFNIVNENEDWTDELAEILRESGELIADHFNAENKDNKNELSNLLIY